MDSYPQYPIVKLEDFPPVLGVLDSYLDGNIALVCLFILSCFMWLAFILRIVLSTINFSVVSVLEWQKLFDGEDKYAVEENKKTSTSTPNPTGTVYVGQVLKRALDWKLIYLPSHREVVPFFFPLSKQTLTFFAGIKFFNFRQQDPSQRFHLVLWNAGAVIIELFLFCQMVTSQCS